ncbi:hypothetical protein D1871_14505 [Nakamurella silvestris]|nr:hypothetical protein D1871_14505 [Nakamurella silvestris]
MPHHTRNREPLLRRVAGLVMICAVLVTAGCTSADPRVRAVGDGGPTAAFSQAVDTFTTAVRNTDRETLAELSGTAGTADGIAELLSRYGSARLTVTDHGEVVGGGGGYAGIDVSCRPGGSAHFEQIFRWEDNRWLAVIFSQADSRRWEAEGSEYQRTAEFQTPTDGIPPATGPALTPDQLNLYPVCA